MGTFDGERLGEEVVHILYQYINWTLGPRLYDLWHPTLLPEAIMEQYRSASLFKDIQLLAHTANGEYDRNTVDKDSLEKVQNAFQRVRKDLLPPLIGVMENPLSKEHPLSLLPQMLRYVEYWLTGNDLITLSEAATLYTGRSVDLNGLKVIQRLVTKWEQGKYDREGRREGLQVIINPNELNPQHNKRVRRSEVEQLRSAYERKRSC